MMSTSSPCTCGHVAEAHEHYRKGSDCGICGRSVCKAYHASNLPAPDTRSVVIEDDEGPAVLPAS